MIVSYETDGAWVSRIPHTSPDEYLIGLFVPNQDNYLRDEFRGISLEEYLRGSEQADHMSWTDWAIDSKRPGIIDKARRQLSRKVADVYRKQPIGAGVRPLAGLGRTLAEILLPPEGFGTKPSVDSRGTTKKTDSRLSRRSTRLALRVVDIPKFGTRGIAVPFELNFGKTNVADLVISAQTETNVLPADKWEEPDEIGVDFPILLQGLHIHKISKGKAGRPSQPYDFRITSEAKRPVEDNGVSLRLIKSQRSQIPYGVRIAIPDHSSYTLTGTIEMQSTDPTVMGKLEVLRVGKEGELP